MTKGEQGLKLSINWEDIEERTGMFLVYSMLIVIGILAGLIAICFMVLIVLIGIYLTMQGWWGIGVPVTAAGIVLDVAVLTFLFAKLMVFIEEKVR